jgi:NADH:ubiquinone oxidoreductase subunit
MSLFKMIFSWWNSATWGTLLTTWLRGVAVGTDAFGNRYYQNKDGSRRWVVYNGTVEASRVPPDWHGWLHHTYPEPPTKAPFKVKSFEAPHKPNLTGTDGAYRPDGSLARTGTRPPATGDYQAWKPE